MEFAITTLNIEIACIESAIRAANLTIFTYEDSGEVTCPRLWTLDGILES